MDSRDFEKNLEKLSDKLEDKADIWFNNPRGYLSKPDFKREQQTKEFIAAGRSMNIFSRMTSSAYKKRWFVLSLKDKILRYYESAELDEEKGSIDLTTIEKIEYSHVCDAGLNSFDLISSLQHFTLTADTLDQCHRWCLAIKRCLKSHTTDSHQKAMKTSLLAPSTSRESVSARTETDEPEGKWHRYDFTYEEPGPMYMNVMGSANKDQYGNLLNQWVIVTAFEITPDGTPGRSEASGVIAVKDYVVGVNGVDLTTSTFVEAMSKIGEASFPKTLHFLRDNEATKESTRIESWATVYYPALNRRRRRYCEIKKNMLNFRKPAPGGSANSERDAFFLIDHIHHVSPILDMNAQVEQTYLLQLHCKPNATVQHVGANDQSVGGSPVVVLELCFSKDTYMNQWRSILISPNRYNGGLGVPVDNMTVIEVGEELIHSSSNTEGSTVSAGAGNVLIESSNLAIKSTLTGNLTKRYFRITDDGHISWKRHRNKGHAVSEGSMRSMLISNSSHCALTNIYAQETSLGEIDGIHYQYQLGIQSKDASLILCFTIIDEVMSWLQAIQTVVAKAPKLTVPETLVFPTDVMAVDAEHALASEGSRRLFEVYGESSGNQSADADQEENVIDMFQGYLYKRNDLLLPKGFSPQAGFTKAWVEIRGAVLNIYRSQIETTSGVAAYLHIPVSSIIEVREATDAGVPENSFEIVTCEKVYIFTATDEDALILWVDAISDLLEARDVAVQKVAALSNTMGAVGQNIVRATPAAADYVQSIKSAIVFSGGMTMKSVNLYTGIVSWRDRFIVVTKGALSYYGDAKDVYNIDAESIGEVNLINILAINTCSPARETRVASLCAFELRAFVSKGGDKDDTRTFVFEARTPELCKQWMDAICDATGKFCMKEQADMPGYYVSEESEDRVREQARLRAGAMQSTTAVLSRRPSVLPNAQGRGVAGGRGGAGRGAAFSQGKVSTINGPAPAATGPTVEEQEAEILSRAADAPRISTSGPAVLQVGGGRGAGRGTGRGAGAPVGRGGRSAGRGFSAPQRRQSAMPQGEV